MKVVIQKITERYETVRGVSKSTGKPYTVNSAMVDCTIDGKPSPSTIVKTMGQVAPELGEYDGTSSEYNGVTSWMLRKPAGSTFGGNRGGNGGWRQPRMSWHRYERFCAACYELARSLDEKNAAALFDKVLGCASVMVEIPADGAHQLPGKPSDMIVPNKKLDVEF